LPLETSIPGPLPLETSIPGPLPRHVGPQVAEQQPEQQLLLPQPLRNTSPTCAATGRSSSAGRARFLSPLSPTQILLDTTAARHQIRRRLDLATVRRLGDRAVPHSTLRGCVRAAGRRGRRRLSAVRVRRLRRQSCCPPDASYGSTGQPSSSSHVRTHLQSSSSSCCSCSCMGD
jgi:hypothetical protein